MSSRFIFLVSLIMAALVVAPVRSQVPMTTPPSCTPAMISSFTPCLNFVTNSSSNGTPAPTSDCCTSLRNLTSGGLGCACLLVTGSIPFQIPINRTLAISLPRACNMPGVPLQCKATTNAPANAPTPGLSSFAPVSSPESSLAPKGAGSEAEAPSLAPESDATPVLTPPSTSTATSTPTSTTGSRSNVTPSSQAKVSYALSPAVAMLAALASALFYHH